MEEVKKEVKTTTKEKNRKITLRTLLVLIALVIFAFIAIVTIRAEYLNMKEIGKEYIAVFKRNVTNKVCVGIASFVITYIIVSISNKFIKKGLKTFFDDEKKQMPKLPNKSLSFVIALAVAMICGVTLAPAFAAFANAAVFGKTDGVFGTDISYYMFTLPFIQNVIITMIILFIALAVYTALYYIITFNVYFDGVEGETIKKSLFLKQLIIYLLIVVILFSGYIIINSQNILTGDMLSIQDEDETKLAGAGLTDITIKLWGYRILAVVIVVAVLRFLKYSNKKSFNQCVVSIAIVPVYLVCMFLVMVYFQEVYVGSNELDREKQYIKYNIEKTKEAYGININQIDISSYSTITDEEIKANSDLIKNIPLISEDVTLSMVEEHQEATGYYGYNRTRLAEYNDKLIYITPREILNENGISYNNRTLKYTHGYSIVASTVADADEDGYAEYLLSDYTNEFDNIKITEPRIYFGLETNSVIATNTKFGQEYDYPITATTYNENVYEGKAGLTLNFWDRLVLGISQKDLKLAFSSYITDDTKIITNRNILNRVKTILPDITYDDNPYLVISKEGRLIWVIDGYTMSNQYPYSQMTVLVSKEDGSKEKINYIRNSVKVLVDAYDGTTTFYITDRTDPIIMTYENIYPGLFAKTDIPEDIAEHFIYPEFLYQIQAQMIGMYHEVSEDTLYRGDDVWKITPTTSSTSGASTKPYYTVVKTVDRKEKELGLVVTFNKEKKQSIISYLVGTYRDGKPSLNLYKFNSNSNIAGIAGLNNQIDQDTTIAAELESLNSSGVRLIKEMKIIPIEDTLLYVEPVYQVMLNEEEEIPVLKKVIVASGNTVAIGNNLAEALENLFTDYAVDFEFVDSEDINTLIDAIVRANNNLQQSKDSNDFEMMGKDISRLENLIKQLEATRKKELEEEEKLKKEQGDSTPVEELIDKFGNILDTIEGGNDTNTVENTIDNTNVVSSENTAIQ